MYQFLKFWKKKLLLHMTRKFNKVYHTSQPFIVHSIMIHGYIEFYIDLYLLYIYI